MTHKFPLVSGVEAEVSELTGLQQKILTEQKNQTAEERNIALLASILVRVGTFDLKSMTDVERTDFIKSMPSPDRKRALCEARQFSNDFDSEFDFVFDYISKDPSKGKQSVVQNVDLGGDSFPFKSMMDFNESVLLQPAKLPNGSVNPDAGKPFRKLRDIEAALKQLKPKVYDTYEELLKNVHYYFTLPKSGVKVRMRMLDGVGDNIIAAIKKENRSSHTTLIARNACYQSPNGATWISFTSSDLDKLPDRDLETMRLVRNYVEGSVDTEIQFEHPEADRLSVEEKMVTIDLLGQLSFFFQSGTI